MDDKVFWISVFICSISGLIIGIIVGNFLPLVGGIIITSIIGLFLGMIIGIIIGTILKLRSTQSKKDKYKL
jgi:F0F1-type ATP synthase assembly protein I